MVQSSAHRHSILIERQAPSLLVLERQSLRTYVSSDNKDHRGRKVEQRPDWHTDQLSSSRGGTHVLYYDGSLKGNCHTNSFCRDAQLQAMSTLAAGIKHFYFTKCVRNHQWRAMPELCVIENTLILLPGSRISATYFQFSNFKHIIKRKNNAGTSAGQGYLEVT
jgi:hypothetical protein